MREAIFWFEFRRGQKAVARPRSREELYPERLGLDSRVIEAALGWINIRDAVSSEERDTWLNIVRSCFDLTLHTVPRSVCQGAGDRWVAESITGANKRLTLPNGGTLDVTIPPGLEDGQILRLRGKGAPGAGNGGPGDALIEVEVLPDRRFMREGVEVFGDMTGDRLTRERWA